MPAHAPSVEVPQLKSQDASKWTFEVRLVCLHIHHHIYLIDHISGDFFQSSHSLAINLSTGVRQEKFIYSKLSPAGANQLKKSPS